ncbi:hypothetical protein ACFWPX_01150 [Nocardia sp. NPDC058518]|uniref:hypothetical protein n=1 Tax=Nocardia sp. NPDC058518 TaxID=3346534 RepID=UPI003664B66E
MSTHKIAVATGILAAFLTAGTVSAQPSAPAPQQQYSEVAGNANGGKADIADDPGSEADDKGKGKGKGKSEGKGKGKGKGKGEADR